jgi:pimeloyl-ACP methyl ester carboxylesterase
MLQPHLSPPANLLDRAGTVLDRRFAPARDGLSLAYSEAGRGPPVILLHGTLTALEDMMIGLAEPLALSHRVIAFDRPGFGQSTVRRFADAGIWRQAEAIHHATVALGLERPIVVGHSFGASVALAMAMDWPDSIGGVVALAPVVRPEARLEQALFGPRATPIAGDWLSLFAGMSSDRMLFPLLWRSMYLPQSMPARVEKEFPFSMAGRSEAAARVGEDSLSAMPDLVRLNSRASSCEVPVRIMGGDRDIVVRNGLNGRPLAEVMPNAQFIDLPGLGHMIHHFATAEIVAVVEQLEALIPQVGQEANVA